MTVQSIQQVMKNSLADQGKYASMSQEMFERETSALASMATKEMEVLMMKGLSQSEAESEAIQIMLKHQAFS